MEILSFDSLENSENAVTSLSSIDRSSASLANRCLDPLIRPIFRIESLKIRIKINLFLQTVRKNFSFYFFLTKSMISITRIDSLRRKIARQLLKKTIKPSPLFLFRCSFLHVPMITARHISNDRVFFIVRMKPYVAGERSSKPDRHHQVVHLLGGFIFVPRGQRNASANAWEFIIIPLTLVFRKEGKKITRALISSSVSFDRE